MFLQYYFWRFHTLLLAIIVSVLGSGTIALGSYYGRLENLELWGYYQYLKLFLENKSDPRVVIVEFDDDSQRTLGHGNISESDLAKTLQILHKCQPRVIAIDIFRHIPIGEETREFSNSFNQELMKIQNRNIPTSAFNLPSS